MAWLYLVIASFGEIFGVMSINLFNRRRSLRNLVLVVVTFGFGFVFLALAMRDIPLGVAYAVWTGLGAAGAVLVGMIWFKEPAGARRILFLCCIIAGAVGLRLVS